MKQIRRILIANRGEIAARIIRACREEGITSILAYSSADKNTLPVEMADESVCIGPPRADRSYLFIPSVIGAAKGLKADAVHPGYGFLAENGDFAEICEEQGLIFIGPSSKSIRLMGDKAAARALMTKIGVPVIPGTPGLVHSAEESLEAAGDMGYPVLVKAAAGGGGKGMRTAETPDELAAAVHEASEEARKAFGSGGVYIEKFMKNVHHVEIQIMADARGHVISLGERDCSAQRKHQKLIEESPSPLMTDALREKMGKAAKKAARAAGYCGAGTVEFVVDRQEQFYFMEMNTRIQVEHPVTEMAVGTDLVRTMIRTAQGGPLPWDKDLVPRGWTIECRINAEDPARQFAPSPGVLKVYEPPRGRDLRVDSAMKEGSVISPFYDSMIAKVIVHKNSREEAINSMEQALGQFHIEGVPTTIPLQKQILSLPAFREGRVDTAYIETHLKDILQNMKEGKS